MLRARAAGCRCPLRRALLYKRLETGTFAVLGGEEINARELYLLLEGIEVVLQRVQYERPHIATR